MNAAMSAGAATATAGMTLPRAMPVEGSPFENSEVKWVVEAVQWSMRVSIGVPIGFDIEAIEVAKMRSEGPNQSPARSRQVAGDEALRKKATFEPATRAGALLKIG